MEREEYRSPDGELTLVVVREGDDITIGFAGLSWHTHGSGLAESSPSVGAAVLSPEQATQRLIADIHSNRAVIAVLEVDGILKDAWLSDDIETDRRYVQPDEKLRFRYWNGSNAEPPAG